MKNRTEKNIVSFLLLCFISVSVSLKAQQVTASSGSHFESATMQISWTLGEPVIKTIGNGTYTLTQGMHQSKLTATSIFEVEDLAFSIQAYPNPTSDYLQIHTERFEGLQLNLYDIQGKLLDQLLFEGDMLEVDFRSLPNGTYLINILCNQRIIKTLKVIKE